MMARVLPIFGSALIPLAWSGESDRPPMDAESFAKGPTHVTEDKFETKLTPAEPTYRERSKDAAGNDRDELTITPEGPDDKITSWSAQRRDLRHSFYSNLLLEEQEPSEDPNNNLGWLNPNGFGRSAQNGSSRWTGFTSSSKARISTLRRGSRHTWIPWWWTSNSRSVTREEDDKW